MAKRLNARAVVKSNQRALKTKWMTVPQMDFQAWFAQYIMAGLALKYYHKYGKFPKRINVGGVTVKELKSGEGLLSAELE